MLPDGEEREFTKADKDKVEEHHGLITILNYMDTKPTI